MKICFVDYGTYSPNLVLVPLYEYSQHMSKEGHSVTIFMLESIGTIRSSENLKIKGVCNEYFFSKITHIIFILKLIFALRKEEFDIVHVFNFAGMALLPIFCKKHRGKWILDIQTGKIKRTLQKRLFDILTVWEAKFFDKVFVISPELRDSLFKRIKPGNCYIIPIGANLSRFSRIKKDRAVWSKYGLQENEKILVYLGYLGQFRKPENILKAFSEVVRLHGWEEVKLAIIGGNPKAALEMLKNTAREMGIDNKVFFLGQIPYEDVPLYLTNSDVGLAYIPKTNLFDLQPPLKTFEYLAASLPVVATNTVAHEQIIKNNINGLITSDNYKDFAEGIIKLLNDESLISRLKANAFDSIKVYDWSNIIKRVMEVYLNK